MILKPTIFIGSSTEGFEVAGKICSLLKEVAECKMWKKAFDFGKSNYDNLISQIALYDYAILIATTDDTIISRNNSFDGPRDNVLFEFGLFAGGLGRSRVFYITEKEAKIPTDLSGITLPTIAKKTSPDFLESIESAAKSIVAHISSLENTYDLSFLPSTALAYGYFTNFVERTVERLLEDRLEGRTFYLPAGDHFVIQDLKFSILVPDDLSSDMFKKVKAKRLKDGWQKLKVDPKEVRDYDFSIDASKAARGELHLVDIPFTLNALHMAIDLYSRKERIGKDEKETLLEHREIRNFKRTLEKLIYSSSITKGIVTVEIVNI